jgi:hypothetical protein
MCAGSVGIKKSFITFLQENKRKVPKTIRKNFARGVD